MDPGMFKGFFSYCICNMRSSNTLLLLFTRCQHYNVGGCWISGSVRSVYDRTARGTRQALNVPCAHQRFCGTSRRVSPRIRLSKKAATARAPIMHDSAPRSFFMHQFAVRLTFQNCVTATDRDSICLNEEYMGQYIRL